MAKLKKIERDIQIKFVAGFLVLVVIFIFFFRVFIAEQRKAVIDHHIHHVMKIDATIATLLGQARLNSYITAKEIAVLLRRIEDREIEKEKLLDHLELVERREEDAGILLAQHILLAVDMEGDILVRSEWIRGERVSLPQVGHIRDNWVPSLAFEQAFTHSLGGEVDVRKIIYDRDFLYREGYDFWGLPGMGLTVMTPMMDEEGEQKGVLISITFVNANERIVAGLKEVTDVAFTAILPTGEVIGSFFEPDSVRKIAPGPEMIAAAKKKAVEKGDLIRRGIKVPPEDFILEEFTIEKIRLTHADRFGGATYYHQVIYWLELDHQGNFASLRGIPKETDLYVDQRNFLIRLIGGITAFLLIIFAFFYFLIQKRLVHPIISFTDQLDTPKEGVKIEISKHYQEFQELEDAFNLSLDQAREAKDVLEIKVKARTRQLNELSASLEEQVKEKTKDLQARIDELERFKNVTIGRETKMIELKEEITRLKGEIERIKNNE